VGKPVTILNPQRRTSRELQALASHYRHVHLNDIRTHQFPVTLAITSGTSIGQ